MDQIRDFFNVVSSQEIACLPNGREIFLSKTILENPDSHTGSVFISQALPSGDALIFLHKILDLPNNEEMSHLYSEAHSWVMTQKNRQDVAELIDEKISSHVGETLKNKITYCLEELSSNAIFAANQDLKTQSGPIVHEKPVKIFLAFSPSAQVLIIRDEYGKINPSAKARILSKITNDSSQPNSRNEEGGAGLGLNLVRELCNFLVIRHHNNQWTETCCVFFKKDISQAPFLFLEV